MENLKKRLVLSGFFLTFLAYIAPLDGQAPWAPQEGAELIGQAAPELIDLEWLNSPELQLSDLSGKVVLIRFWLVGCGFCTRTAPALNELHQNYSKEGLVVIGIHHPKSVAGRQAAVVKKAAADFGFEFPIAMDNNWSTINAYWTNQNRSFTSSSFLIDQQGIIRWVHHGGEFYREGRNPEEIRAFHSVERTIRELLGLSQS